MQSFEEQIMDILNAAMLTSKLVNGDLHESEPYIMDSKDPRILIFARGRIDIHPNYTFFKCRLNRKADSYEKAQEIIQEMIDLNRDIIVEIEHDSSMFSYILRFKFIRSKAKEDKIIDFIKDVVNILI